MPSNFMESHHIIRLTAAQQPKGEDMYETAIVSDVINLSNWGGMYVIVQELAGGTGTADFSLEACDDVTPTTSPAITGGWWFRTSTTADTWSAWELEADATTRTTAGASKLVEIFIPSSVLEGTTNQYNYKYVRWTLTEVVDSPVDGSVICMLVDPKVAEEIPTTAIV